MISLLSVEVWCIVQCVYSKTTVGEDVTVVVVAVCDSLTTKLLRLKRKDG